MQDETDLVITIHPFAMLPAMIRAHTNFQLDPSNFFFILISVFGRTLHYAANWALFIQINSDSKIFGVCAYPIAV